MAMHLRRAKTDDVSAPPRTRPEASSAAVQARVDGVDWTMVHADPTRKVGPWCRIS
jgi:hypothetical protein